MFHLVNKRYLFLIISLVIIVPGLVSFLFKGLNVGIDFAGGATVNLRPSQSITAQQARTLLAPVGLQNLSITNGDNTGIPKARVAWVLLNTLVDGNVTQEIQNRLKNGYNSNKGYGSQLVIQLSDVSYGGKTVTLITISNFNSNADAGNIEKLLSKLPNTTKVSTTSASPTVTATTTPTVTPTPKATGTPKATATPAAKATSAPATKATGTPTATATPTASSTANIKVNWTSVKVGTTTQTFTILTSTLIDSGKQNAIQSALLKGGIYTYVVTSASVSPAIAAQTTNRAVLAVLAASIFILLYVWFAFRKVPKPWRYGTCAIIALLHDVLVVVGVFSILGWVANVQIDTLFITALLTVVGFSVHDTIVVFDRIRENMQRRTTESFEQVVNASLVQTLARSLNTSLTVLFTLSALTLFGGDSIRTFTLALLIGIFSGTYSSIFNASMLLVIWEKGELGTWRFQRRRRLPDGREVRERDLVRSR